MPSPIEAGPALNQLRFVFEDSAPYLCFVSEVTSGDIARLWSEISHRHPNAPIAIDLTLAPEPNTPADTAPAMGWLPAHLPWTVARAG